MNKKLVLRVARNLLAGYTKDTGGAPKKWDEANAEEQELWKRMARRAIRLVVDEGDLPNASNA